MELQGLVVTLHPLATQGAINAKDIDLDPAVTKFTNQLTKRLTKAGLDVHALTAGGGSQGISISTQLVRAEPGRTGQSAILGPLLTSMLGGSAVFEVEGQIGQGSAPLAQVHAVGKNSGSAGKMALKSAAVLTGNLMAKQIVKALKAS